MSTETITQTLTAGTKAYWGAGTIFLIAAATGPLNIIARTLGSSNKNRVLTNVPAGMKFTADTPDDGFDLLEVTSATSQTVTIAVGNDDVEFSNAVSVTGSVSTQETPKQSIADTPKVVTPAGPAAHQGALFAGNGGRRGISVFAEPTNNATVYFRTAGGVNTIGFIQPGTSVDFDGVYAIDYLDNSAAGANTLYIFEES